MSELKLKICGMREPQNIAEVVEQVCPDYLGFIFYEKSPRNGMNLDPQVLQNLENTQRVGVFVNGTIDFVLEKAKTYSLDLLQLHGEESPQFCQDLKEKGFKISKAIGVKDELNHDLLREYENSIDFFLFDTKGENRGGNGIVFDWSILKSYQLDIPFFLAGGIDEFNIADLAILKGLPLYAIDVNSKFELKPGLKDVSRLIELKKHVQLLN